MFSSSLSGNTSGFSTPSTIARPGVSIPTTQNNIQVPSSTFSTTTSLSTQPQTPLTTTSTQTNQPVSGLTMAEIQQSFQKISEELLPNEPKTLFKGIFYNYADDPSEVQMHTMNRPLNVDPDIWEQAIKYNPKPKKYVCAYLALCKWLISLFTAYILHK